MQYHFYFERGGTEKLNDRWDDSEMYYNNINDNIGLYFDPYSWNYYEGTFELVENIREFSDLCVYRNANPQWKPKSKRERRFLYENNIRFISDQPSGHGTAPLAKLIAARHIVMANIKNSNPLDPRNYATLQGEARVTRGDEDVAEAAPTWQPSQHWEDYDDAPSSSTARWQKATTAQPVQARNPYDMRSHEHWEWNDENDTQLESEHWYLSRQEKDWNQYWQHGYDTPEPNSAQAYAAQSSWEEPYPDIPGPSRQFVDDAWKTYNKRRNDDRSQDDSPAWKGSRRR